MTFDGTVPVTWADVISIISTIIAFIAVIVAIVANYKASQSLDYSIKIQEQSKNVDLFDKRTSLIREIKKTDKTSRLLLELLFNESIAKEYDDMLNIRQAHLDAKHDLNVYRQNLKESDGEGGFLSPMAEIEDAENKLEELEYPPDEVKKFEELCGKHEMFYSETGKEEDFKLYNYNELTKKIESTEREFENQKEDLLKQMKHFIAASISPIDGKGETYR